MPYDPSRPRVRSLPVPDIAAEVDALRAELSELNEDVSVLFDQVTVLTHHLALLLQDLSAEPLDDYPPESEEAEAGDALEEPFPALDAVEEADEYDETPEEEAARLRREAAEQFVRDNESEAGPVDFNDVVDVPEEGRDV